VTGELAVEVRDLVKEFPAPGGGTLTAVDRVSFEVHRGEVFGFLGPNGAGKTTTLEIIEGLQDPTSGHTKVLGLDSLADRSEMKERVGVQLQAGAYFNYLTLEEILDLFGSFYPKAIRPAELLEKVGLLEKRKALVRELSGGQAQRFSIVAAMVNDPEIVFLDEPTTGLDPQSRRQLWDIIRDLRSQGRTTLLTTHYMDEAERLCDRVAVVDHGKVISQGSPTELIATLGGEHVVEFALVNGASASNEEYSALPAVREARSDASGVSLTVTEPHITIPALLALLQSHKLELARLTTRHVSLEDVFVHLTGRHLRDDEVSGA
jgi:ABC-2 type transport system ATP-binding protein